MDYDVAAYVEQVKTFQNEHEQRKDLSDKEFLCKMKKTDLLLPAFTLVLYLGENKWDGAASLHEMLDFGKVPGEIHPYIENYSIHVLDVMHEKDERLMEFPKDIACMFLVIKYQKDKSRLAELVERTGMFHAVNMMIWNVRRRILHIKRNYFGSMGFERNKRGKRKWQNM